MLGGMVGKETQLFSTAFQLCHACCVCMQIANSSSTFSDIASRVAPKDFIGEIVLHLTETEAGREKITLPGPQGREPSCPKHRIRTTES